MAKNRFEAFRNSKEIYSHNAEALKISNVFNPCIFLSHQKGDSSVTKIIADYIISLGIDVYFDEYDVDAKIANQTNNPKAVTKAILKGIQISSHMLCIVSQNTIKSSWVPFEIGYGYDKTQVGVLMLKSVDFNNLPEYLKSVDIYIRDIYDINDFLEKVNKIFRIEKKGHNYDDPNHPLLSYMERFIQ